MEAERLGLLLANCLQLVVPASMTTDDRAAWILSAVDALEGIRPDEIESVSAELRRKVKRHTEIVPEIANLVAEKRARSNRTQKPTSPFFAEMEITRRSQEMRAKANTQSGVEEAWQWERNARIDAGLPVSPIEKPLGQYEMSTMPAHVIQLGLKSGFLKRDGEMIVEVNDPAETDEIRERQRRANHISA